MVSTQDISNVIATALKNDTFGEFQVEVRTQFGDNATNATLEVVITNPAAELDPSVQQHILSKLSAIPALTNHVASKPDSAAKPNSVRISKIGATISADGTETYAPGKLRVDIELPADQFKSILEQIVSPTPEAALGATIEQATQQTTSPEQPIAEIANPQTALGSTLSPGSATYKAIQNTINKFKDEQPALGT